MTQLIIGFSKPKSKWAFGAKSIMWFEGTPYSHVYLKWHSTKYDRDLFYEAKGNGVNFTSPIHFKEAVQIVEEYSLEISDEANIKVMQYAIDNARAKYGYWQLLGIVLVKVGRKLGLTFKNPLTSGTICSELAGIILEHCLDLEVPDDLEMAGPKDINDFIKTVGTKL
jgi:hypothetical protein